MQEKLASILNKYILENGDIHPYAILRQLRSQNLNDFKNFNFQNLDSLGLRAVKDFPVIPRLINAVDLDLKEFYAQMTDDYLGRLP